MSMRSKYRSERDLKFVLADQMNIKLRRVYSI